MTPATMIVNAIRTSGGHRGRLPRQPVRRPLVPSSRLTPSVVPPHARRGIIYALSAKGHSCDEIVRRTGFAYDAVEMLLACDTPTPTPSTRR